MLDGSDDDSEKANGNNNERRGVSSLASRFEQLATTTSPSLSSASSNSRTTTPAPGSYTVLAGNAVPPVRPAKPAFLKTRSSELSINSNGSLRKAGASIHAELEAGGSSRNGELNGEAAGGMLHNDSSAAAETEETGRNSGYTSPIEHELRKELVSAIPLSSNRPPPPPIPRDTRPPNSSSSFTRNPVASPSQNGESHDSLLLAKRSAPPPVPSPRPSSPILALPPATSSISAGSGSVTPVAAEPLLLNNDDSLPRSVASLAARFGAASSRGSTPASTSPYSKQTVMPPTPTEAGFLSLSRQAIPAPSSPQLTQVQQTNATGQTPFVPSRLPMPSQIAIQIRSPFGDEHDDPFASPQERIGVATSEQNTPTRSVISTCRPVPSNPSRPLEMLAASSSPEKGLFSAPLVHNLSTPDLPRAPYSPAPPLPARKQSDSSLFFATTTPVAVQGSRLGTSPPPPPLPSRAKSPRPHSYTASSPSASTLAGTNKDPFDSIARAQSPHRRAGTVKPHPSKPTSASQSYEDQEAPYLPPPPPARTHPAVSSVSRNTTTSPPTSHTPIFVPSNTTGNGISTPAANGSHGEESDSDYEVVENEETMDGIRRVHEMPDATFANRRPPKITPERTISPKHAINASAICGRYLVTASTHIRVWDTQTGESKGTILLPGGETKVTAVEFIYPEGQVNRGGQTVWAGTKDGSLFEIDLEQGGVVNTRTNAHSHFIMGIFRAPGNMVVTVCDSGKVNMWSSDSVAASPSLAGLPRTQRMSDKHTFVQCVGTCLWSSQGPVRSHLASSSAVRSPSIRMYDVNPASSFSHTPRPVYLPESAGIVGAVLSGTIIPSQPNLVYLSHESGHVSIWEKDTLNCISVLRISTFAITALEGVLDHLWAGNREGTIHIYDVTKAPWRVVKAWKASEEPISELEVDLGTIATVSLQMTTNNFC